MACISLKTLYEAGVRYLKFGGRIERTTEDEYDLYTDTHHLLLRDGECVTVVRGSCMSILVKNSETNVYIRFSPEEFALATEEKQFEEGDIVFVSNPDIEYEKEMGERTHRSFFGKVTEVNTFSDETCVTVEFPATPNGTAMEWSYNANELSLAKEVKNMTLEEFSNKYGVTVMAEYL